MTTMTTMTAIESETVAHIVGAGIVGADDIIGITTLHQRSLCYRVDARDGRSFFVKRARRDADGRLPANPVQEGRVIQAARRHGLPVPCPRLVLDDPDQDVRMLVTDYLPGRQPLSSLRRTPAGRDRAVGAALGRLLADIHGTPLDAVERSTLTTRNPGEPLLLGYVTLTPARYAAMSPAARLVAGRLQRDDLPSLLRAVTEDWRPRSLVHGDVKSDNVLVRLNGPAGPAGPAGTDTVGPDWPDVEVRLVDWELAGSGDPDADIGWLAGDAYAAWLGSMPFTPSGTVADWARAATVPFAEMAAQVRAAISAYTQRRPVTSDAPTRWARYAGLFLLHRACAASLRGPDLSPLAAACLQVGGELLRHPSDHQEMFG